MRRKHFLAMAFCMLALVSCDFEQDFGDSRSSESADVALTVKATADDAFAQAKGGLWNAGDALKLRLSGDTYESETDCISLAAATTGTDGVSFEGMLPSFRGNDNAYMYFSADGEFAGTGFTKTISAEQSGNITDIYDHVLYYSWARWDAMSVSADGKSVEISTKMVPMAALLKFNVPAELQAENVRIKASSPITGTVTVHPQMGWGSVGENALFNAQVASDEIVINSGNPVSGDLYVVVLPDSFDRANNNYCNSAQTITFSCTHPEGDLVKRYAMSDCIPCGVVTDLGAIPMPKPKVPVEGGKIRFMPDANLTIGVSDPNPDCEYYYEIGSSAADCAEPTVNSTKFDPETGFAPEITGHFDRYYIKVLAHPLDTDYKGVVLSASLRNWKFQKGCPVDAIISEIAEGNKLQKGGDKEMTSHGLEIYKNTDNALTDYEAPVNRVAFTTARVQINAITEYASDAWIGFFVDKNVSVKSGTKRGYRFYYNNSQSTNSYWTTSITSSGTTSDRYNICLHLTDIFKDNGIKAGDKFGLRGDGKHVLYGIALLEVL